MIAETKNQSAWNEIDRRLSFVQAIKRKEEFDISANQIKEISGREPRLMGKFDHSINRPSIFKDNNIAILPVSGSSYKLLPFNSYHPLRYSDDVTSVSSAPLNRYESINKNNVRSEDSALIISDIAGIVQNFTKESDLKCTTRGKFGLGKFDFSVVLNSGIQKKITVDRAQSELDIGFEGEKLYLLEAKIGKIDDFNIRQLYFPYRFWSNKLKKQVVPIFFTYSDGVFSFWEFDFVDKENFNSIRLIRHTNYTFEQDIISKDILNIAQFIPSGSSEIPFPQADDFEKVINIAELINNGINSKEEFADYFAFDKRQADYYFNAAMYLGMVDGKKDDIKLTEFGKKIVKVGRNERHQLLIQQILRHKVFYDVFMKLRSTGVPSADEVIDLMKKNKVLVGSPQSMFTRRSKTVLAWCKWIQGCFN